MRSLLALRISASTSTNDAFFVLIESRSSVSELTWHEHVRRWHQHRTLCELVSTSETVPDKHGSRLSVHRDRDRYRHTHKRETAVRWADRHACMRLCTLTASDLSALLARSEVQQNACRMTRSPQPTLAPTRCWWLSALRLHSSRLQHHQRRPMPLLMRLWLWLRLILRGQACRNDSLRPLLQWLRGVVLQVLV